MWVWKGHLHWKVEDTTLFTVASPTPISLSSNYLYLCKKDFRMRSLPGSDLGGCLLDQRVFISSLEKDLLFLKNFCWQNMEGIYEVQISDAPGILLYRLPPHLPLGFPGQKGRTSCRNFKASVALILFLAQWRWIPSWRQTIVPCEQSPWGRKGE